jgi:hypothetical protein
VNNTALPPDAAEARCRSAWAKTEPVPGSTPGPVLKIAAAAICERYTGSGEHGMERANGNP